MVCGRVSVRCEMPFLRAPTCDGARISRHTNRTVAARGLNSVITRFRALLVMNSLAASRVIRARVCVCARMCVCAYACVCQSAHASCGCDNVPDQQICPPTLVILFSAGLDCGVGGVGINLKNKD